MKPGAALATLVMAVLLPASSAAQPPARRQAGQRQPGNEPFTTFQLIDKQLEIVNARSRQLEHAPPPAAAQALRELRGAALKIEQLSNRLVRIYKARRERFGMKMFSDLSRRAAVVAKAARAVAKSRNDAVRQRAREQLARASVALVLKYQGAAANYGALRCDRGQWACCEPRAPEPNGPRVHACTWVCVAHRARCRGFSGPQTAAPR
jgi:hypothetical protein